MKFSGYPKPKRDFTAGAVCGARGTICSLLLGSHGGTEPQGKTFNFLPTKKRFPPSRASQSEKQADSEFQDLSLPNGSRWDQPQLLHSRLPDLVAL